MKNILILALLLLLSSVKIYAQPKVEWITRTPNIYASAIAVDSSGNVYTAERNLIKFSPNGKLLWSRVLPSGVINPSGGAIIELDKRGNIFVLQYTQPGVIKYDSAGEKKWIATDSNDRPYSKATDMSLDDSGNIYISDNDSLLKFDSSGEKKWKTKCGSAVSIKVSKKGYIIVTGISEINGGYPYVTTRYNTNGIPEWVSHEDSTLGSPVKLYIGEDENIYVTGFSDGPVDGFVTIKYDSSGNQKWIKRYDESVGLSYSDIPIGIIVNNNGNVFVVGYSRIVNHTTSPSFYWTTVMYDSLGNQKWVTQYIARKGDNRPYGLVADKKGNVYVTGYGSDYGTDKNFTTIKYDSTGKQLWADLYVGFQSAAAITIDSKDNVYVAGPNQWLDSTAHGLIGTATIKYGQSDLAVKQSSDASSDLGFKIFPNPFSQSTTIKFSSSDHSFAQVSIHNLLGSEVARLFMGSLDAEEHSFTWDAHGMPPGMYVCLVKCDGEVKEIPLMVVK